MRRAAYKVVVAQAAHNDYEVALDYIAQVPCAPSATERLHTESVSTLSSLMQNPAFYPVHSGAIEIFRRTMYWRSVDSYRLFYVVDRERSPVTVFSFLHKSQDAMRVILIDYRSSREPLWRNTLLRSLCLQSGMTEFCDHFRFFEYARDTLWGGTLDKRDEIHIKPAADAREPALRRQGRRRRGAGRARPPARLLRADERAAEFVRVEGL